jgi:glycerol uptake facilitator-like aquaporin
MTIRTAQSKSGFAPLIIGFMIMVLVMTGSSVSGSGFNPARAFGPAVFTGVWTDHWIYWFVSMHLSPSL